MMNVEVKSIEPATKPHRLADATVDLLDSAGDSFTISDIRILQNRQGTPWVTMPSRSIADGNRSFQYLPQIECSKQLHRKIEDAVLEAFEKWKLSRLEVAVRS
jgi:DNA-binding cell septation regulator SpoVG